MIPNETNGEISRNNFVQLRLGELSNQPENTFSEVIKQPTIKRDTSINLDKETTDILDKISSASRSQLSEENHDTELLLLRQTLSQMDKQTTKRCYT